MCCMLIRCREAFEAEQLTCKRYQNFIFFPRLPPTAESLEQAIFIQESPRRTRISNVFGYTSSKLVPSQVHQKTKTFPVFPDSKHASRANQSILFPGKKINFCLTGNYVTPRPPYYQSRGKTGL